MRHLIKSNKWLIIVYTDYGSSVSIMKQTTLFSTSSDHQNKHLIWASEYIQRFHIKVWYKAGQTNYISDTLSRLLSYQTIQSSTDKRILDIFFSEIYIYIITLVKMSDSFKAHLLADYSVNKFWTKILEILEANKALKKSDQAVLSFEIEKITDLIYHIRSEEVQCLCIFNHKDLIKNVLQLAHNKIGHPGFHRIYEWIIRSLYIRKLYILLYEFIWHCSFCQAMTSPWHNSYESLQSITTSVSSHYIIMLDFVIGLSTSTEGFDCAISVTDKHSKWVMFISDKIMFTAAQWVQLLLKCLVFRDWEILKAIISDWDRKFVNEIWHTIFQKKSVELLYSIAYHPQSDRQSEQMNQTFEIALCHYIADLEKLINWLSVLLIMQLIFNNFTSQFTGQSLNKILYEKKICEVIDHLNSSTITVKLTLQINPIDVIDFANM